MGELIGKVKLDYRVDRDGDNGICLDPHEVLCCAVCVDGARFADPSHAWARAEGLIR